MDEVALKSELTRDEGRKSRLYQDTVGKWTGGIGHNFTDQPLSDEVIDLLYEEDSTAAFADLDRWIPWWRGMSEARQRVMANMRFNLGSKIMEFKRMLAAAECGDYPTAAREMLDSDWAIQVGDRADRLAKMMEEG